MATPARVRPPPAAAGRSGGRRARRCSSGRPPLLALAADRDTTRQADRVGAVRLEVEQAERVHQQRLLVLAVGTGGGGWVGWGGGGGGWVGVSGGGGEG